MNIKRTVKLNPVYWGLLLFIIAQILVILITYQIDPFLEDHNIFVPSQPLEAISWWPGEATLPSGQITEIPAYSSLGPVFIYVLAVAAIVGLVFSFIPITALKFVLRLLFALMFSWGAFIATVFYLPLPLAITIGVMLGAAWLLIPFIWLHNLVLILALTSLGAVFGRFITPWTAMLLIILMAVYDFLAVRFKFMTWMADQLIKIEALPAIIIPKDYSGWSSNLKQDRVIKLLAIKSTDKKCSILGGGDIAFPCLLTASVYFAQGLIPAAIIALFGLLGLIVTYSIQKLLIKEKPMPALPPIAALTLVGLLFIS